MEPGVSIIYANRNRDVTRINNSLISLQNQVEDNFEVIFVDYGSHPSLVKKYSGSLENYNFVHFYPLEVPQLLWNKSKALNYGLKRATKNSIFIADVDLIFHPDTIGFLNSVADPKKFFLFPLNYLNKQESQKLIGPYDFEKLEPERKGKVNGMILASSSAVHEVWGLDEFFHFYGAEDEDLFGRLVNAGYEKVFCDKNFFLHNWHPSFSGSEDKLLTSTPRLKNIMRINQQHFKSNMENKRTRPSRQKSWGEVISLEESMLLSKPTKTYKLTNVLARVEHFLNEELPSLGGEIIEVEFYEDPYYTTIKHKVKKVLGKQTQPYCSMKEVNDLLLKAILFRYRFNNYSFKIDAKLKRIYFKIALC